MSTGTFDIGICFKKAFEVYKKNLGLLIGASLVGSLLISLTAGILAGPILAGLMVLVLKLVDEKDDAEFSDLFGRFDLFATTFLLCLAWGAAFYAASLILSPIPFLGTLAVIVLSGAFSVFLLFAIMQVVEQQQGFQAACKSAFELLKKDLWMLIAYGILASLAAGVGALACGIGIILTMPILYVLMAVAYRHCAVTGSEESSVDAPVEMDVKTAEPVVEEASIVPDEAPEEESPEEESPVEPKAE